MLNKIQSHHHTPSQLTTASMLVGLTKEQMKEVDEIQKLINSRGELNMKDKKVAIIPLVFYKMNLDHIVVLDIRDNFITELNAEVCGVLKNLKKLDARNNQIETIAPQISNMKCLEILRLDSNQITFIPDQLSDLVLIEELSFSKNKVKFLPKNMSQLQSLKLLNIANNQIQKIPEEIGSIKTLWYLYIHGNRFTSFPCSFVNLVDLQEFSLEWFLYSKPPRSKLVKRNHKDGNDVFESLQVLCKLLQKYKMNECALITFLENYSENVFDVNNTDNRQRTPLHNAAVKGDIGVLEGLLMGKADPNQLDKDNCSPLCLAIREENFEGASILINQNVDPNKGGGIYGSPMHLAVVQLEIWIIKALIIKNADLNKPDCDGSTPLHLVMNVFSKNPQRCACIAETLVMNGAKVNIKNNDNWAPIHSAARKGQEKGIQSIIKLNQLLEKNQMEQFDYNITGGAQQWTALHLAAHGGHFTIIQELVAAGADIFQRNSNNQLPRHCAKGNYILTKFFKLGEQYTSQNKMQEFHISSQYEFIKELVLRPNTTTGNSSTQQTINFLNKSSQSLQSQGVNTSQLSINTNEKNSQNYVSFISNVKSIKKMKSFKQRFKNTSLSGNMQNKSFHIKGDMLGQNLITGKNSSKPTPFNLMQRQPQLGMSTQQLQDDLMLSNSGTQIQHYNNLQGHNNNIMNQTQQQQVADDMSDSSGKPFNNFFNNTQSTINNLKGTQQALNTTQSNQQDPLNQSSFNQLSQIAEQKRINFYYQKDQLIKDTSNIFEKLSSLNKIKAHNDQVGFCQAICTLLDEFDQIENEMIQEEILNTIACSKHHQLIVPLQKLLVRLNQKISKQQTECSEHVLDLIENCIHSLNIVKLAKLEQVQVRQMAQNRKAIGQHNRDQPMHVIKSKSTLSNNHTRHKKDSSESEHNEHDDSDNDDEEAGIDIDRNVNFFKMKGISSIGHSHMKINSINMQKGINPAQIIGATNRNQLNLNKSTKINTVTPSITQVGATQHYLKNQIQLNTSTTSNITDSHQQNMLLKHNMSPKSIGSTQAMQQAQVSNKFQSDLRKDLNKVSQQENKFYQNFQPRGTAVNAGQSSTTILNEMSQGMQNIKQSYNKQMYMMRNTVQSQLYQQKPVQQNLHSMNPPSSKRVNHNNNISVNSSASQYQPPKSMVMKSERVSPHNGSAISLNSDMKVHQMFANKHM